MSEFKKFDGKKNRLELIEPEFILGLGRVLSFGADKYEAHNWKKATSIDDQDRIKGAMLRHMMAYIGGEKTDPETGESHLHHISCNSMFLNHFDMKGFGREVKEEYQTPQTWEEARKQKPMNERYSIERWLDDSEFTYLGKDQDGDLRFHNAGSNTEFAMRNYNQFFDWLVKEYPDLYLRNGGSMTHVKTVHPNR